MLIKEQKNLNQSSFVICDRFNWLLKQVHINVSSFLLECLWSIWRLKLVDLQMNNGFLIFAIVLFSINMVIL